ncbi:MAG: hypothetical protein OIF57_12640 [Marinobacterium sp.]|nr:hypothetical protein [Marinobacterium sp.]
MNRPQTKAEQRAVLARQVEEFLAGGGAIKEYRMGETALVDGNYNNRNIIIEHQGPRTRTPVPEAVAAIETRRRAGKRSSAPTRRTAQPRQRRKVIYDDFGEPLRTIWIDE